MKGNLVKGNLLDKVEWFAIFNRMSTQNLTFPTVAIADLAAQMRATERDAYEREVEASLARGLAQAVDPASKKHTLGEMHARVSKTIARMSKVQALA